MCKLSVIVVCKNNFQDLTITINSIFKSCVDFSNIEIVIVYNDLCRNLIVDLLNTSESPVFNYKILQDEGISIWNAMNEGIHNSSGDFIWFLNSGDECIRSISLILNSLEDLTCYHFQVLIHRSRDYYYKNNKFIHHLGFISPRTNIFYDEKHVLSADTYWIKKQIQKFGYKSSQDYICRFYFGGISTQPSINLVILKFRQNLFTGIKSFIYYLIKVLLGNNISFYMWRYKNNLRTYE